MARRILLRMANLYSPNTASQCPLSRLAGTGSTPMLISLPFMNILMNIQQCFSIVDQFKGLFHSP